MMTQKQWIDIKLKRHKDEPYDTIKDVLATTNNVINQYLKSGRSKTALLVLETAFECNDELLKKLDE